ncbi:MAG: protein TolQ, partial [Rhodanobacter sp.]
MNGGLNIFSLIADSSLPVQLVLLVLLVFSFMSWVIIVR